MNDTPPDDQWHAASWMQTYTGKAFRPMDPRPDDVCIEDIAHALSMQCRYNGHVKRFASVAEHCVLVSRHVPARDALWGLLHDATEAYVGDMVRPLKIHMPAFREAEDRVMEAIAEKFGLNPQMPASVHEADSRILLDERAALLGEPPRQWAVDGLAPLGCTVHGWSPAEAEQAYLRRFAELTASGPVFSVSLDPASVRDEIREAFTDGGNPHRLTADQVDALTGLSDTLIGDTIQRCLDDSFWEVYDQTRSRVIAELAEGLDD